MVPQLHQFMNMIVSYCSLIFSNLNIHHGLTTPVFIASHYYKPNIAMIHNRKYVFQVKRYFITSWSWLLDISFVHLAITASP